MISSPRSPIMKILSRGRQLGMHSFQIQARFRSAQATPIRSTANGIVILTTVELTLGKGYGESHVGLCLAMSRSHGKALTAFVVNKYPYMLGKCQCIGL